MSKGLECQRYPDAYDATAYGFPRTCASAYCNLVNACSCLESSSAYSIFKLEY